MQGYFSSPAKLMVNYFAISLNRVICATAAAIVSSFNSVIPQTGYNEYSKNNFWISPSAGSRVSAAG